MANQNYFLRLLFTGVLSIGVCACATTETSRITATGDKTSTFDAMAQALVKSGYTVTTVERDTGIITAERNIKQALTGRESSFSKILITLIVIEEAGQAAAVVTWSPPSFAMGSFAPEQKELLAALRASAPGLIFEEAPIL
jgi:hypothetical protein